MQEGEAFCSGLGLEGMRDDKNEKKDAKIIPEKDKELM